MKIISPWDRIEQKRHDLVMEISARYAVELSSAEPAKHKAIDKTIEREVNAALKEYIDQHLPSRLCTFFRVPRLGSVNPSPSGDGQVG